MGYIAPALPPPDYNLIGDSYGNPFKKMPPPLNLDRFGMPRDYATYMWTLYKKIVEDNSPARRAFLNKNTSGYFGFSLQYDWR